MQASLQSLPLAGTGMVGDLDHEVTNEGVCLAFMPQGVRPLESCGFWSLPKVENFKMPHPQSAGGEGVYEACT